MTLPVTGAAQATVRLERRYENAEIRDLWELWTTREGFESWWGPQGFRVAVQKLDLRVGGDLVYDMIAAEPAQIAFMKQANMPLSHTARARFGAMAPLQHLELVHIIDFVPGMQPYEQRIRVEFSSEPGAARMVVNVEPHTTPEWTQRAVMGMESQLTKVPGILAARAQRR